MTRANSLISSVLTESKADFTSDHDPDEQSVSVLGKDDDAYLAAHYSTAKEMARYLRDDFGDHGLADHIEATHKPGDRIAYISGFEVDPELRGRGLGSRMMGSALEHLRVGAKAKHVYLNLHSGQHSDVPARRVYARHGLTELAVPGLMPVFHKKL